MAPPARAFFPRWIDAHGRVGTAARIRPAIGSAYAGNPHMAGAHVQSLCAVYRYRGGGRNRVRDQVRSGCQPQPRNPQVQDYLPRILKPV
jgi:hypothetical protein